MTRRKRPEDRPAQGFTLIEVLVALVIVALGMSALLGTLTSAANGAAYLRDKIFAQWVALNQIATVRLQQQLPSLGNSSGEVELANRKWTWQQTVTKLDVPGVMRIDVSVRPSDVVPAKGSKDQNWFVTITGVKGDALAQPVGRSDYGDISAANEECGGQYPDPNEQPKCSPNGPGTSTPITTPTVTPPTVPGTGAPGPTTSSPSPQ